MIAQPGDITFIGSGEFGEAISRVYRAMLARLVAPVDAVFLNTPAGFEVNADEIDAKAVEYFRRRFDIPLGIASWRSRDRATEAQAQAAVQALRSADFILAGPGSPTYAIRQWRDALVWQAVIHRLGQGAHVVFASAAAIAAGREALPIYEIYKAGHDIHWVAGLDLLGDYGLALAVVPHWNNAEGGKYDTRRCYMGQVRWNHLEELLPTGTTVLGIDEHTAVTLDLKSQTVTVAGVGRITVRRAGQEWIYPSGAQFSMDRLRATRPDSSP